MDIVAIGLAFSGPGSGSLDGVLGWQLSGLWPGFAATAVAVAGGAAVPALARRSRTQEHGDLGHDVEKRRPAPLTR